MALNELILLGVATSLTAAASISYMQNLKNRVALVTGASRGIGAGIALALARAGADVAVNYHKNADAAATVCREISALGRRALAVQADVSVAAEVRRVVAEVETRLGSVDILVNNAGIAHPQRLEDITEQDWDEVLTTNLKSVFLVTQAVIGGMRARKWGRIINLSSVAAQTGGAVGLRALQALAKRAGLAGDFGLHKFCKSYATLQHKAGVDARTIQKRLGHSDLPTTLAYLEGEEARSEQSRAQVNGTFNIFA